MMVSVISILEKSDETSLPSPSIKGRITKFNNGGKAATAVYRKDSLKNSLLLRFVANARDTFIGLQY